MNPMRIQYFSKGNWEKQQNKNEMKNKHEDTRIKNEFSWEEKKVCNV